MERKLSDKERFIIQVAVNRSAENHFDRKRLETRKTLYQ